MNYSTVVIHCNVDLAAALAAGKVTAGRLTVRLTPEILVILKEDGLMDLAEPYMGLESITVEHFPVLSIDPTTPGWMERPVSNREEREAEGTRVFEAQQAAVLLALRNERDRRSHALELHRKLVDYAGDRSQRVRLAAGVLPHSELEDLLREAVFSEVTAPRYNKFPSRDLCEHGDSLIFLTSPCSELTAAEHDALTALSAQLAAARGAASAFIEEIDLEVGKLEHHATCTRCHRRFARRSAQVRFRWGGLAVGREYLLTLGAPRVTTDK